MLLICLFGISPLAQTPGAGSRQTAAPDFDARAIERGPTISGRTCSNSLIGVKYELSDGMQIEDAQTSRIVKARGERGRTGIGPEAEYILWGSGERHSIVYLCNGYDERGQVMATAIPLTVLRSYGPGGLEALVRPDRPSVHRLINRARKSSPGAFSGMQSRMARSVGHRECKKRFSWRLTQQKRALTLSFLILSPTSRRT